MRGRKKTSSIQRVLSSLPGRTLSGRMCQIFRFVSTSYLWSRSSYRWVNGGIEGATMRRGNFYESRKPFSLGDKADGEVSSS